MRYIPPRCRPTVGHADRAVVQHMALNEKPFIFVSARLSNPNGFDKFLYARAFPS
jgi:hypothetical protein